MTYDAFNSYCSALPASSYVMQWGGSHVWKVGGKVFVVGGWQELEPAYSFKVEVSAFAFLASQTGLRPAPYFASRGMKWIQCYEPTGVGEAQLKQLIVDSHRIVARGLTQKKRRELGLDVL